MVTETLINVCNYLENYEDLLRPYLQCCLQGTLVFQLMIFIFFAPFLFLVVLIYVILFYRVYYFSKFNF